MAFAEQRRSQESGEHKSCSAPQGTEADSRSLSRRRGQREWGHRFNAARRMARSRTWALSTAEFWPHLQERTPLRAVDSQGDRNRARGNGPVQHLGLHNGRGGWGGTGRGVKSIPMHIVEVVKLEDCFDGSAVYRYLLASAWTRENILALRHLGEVQYFSSFPRPYFRLRSAQGLIAQGVEGESSCRATFPRRNKEEIRRTWNDALEAIPVEECLWHKS